MGQRHRAYLDEAVTGEKETDWNSSVSSLKLHIEHATKKIKENETTIEHCNELINDIQDECIHQFEDEGRFFKRCRNCQYVTK